MFRNQITIRMTIVGLMAATARADVYYVDGTCGNDGWAGTNPECVAPDGPKATIQAGIDAASNGDTVLVRDGTYTGTGNKNLDFAGRLIIVRSENGPDTCIIDCENAGRGFYFHSGETDTSVVDGFTITNGNVQNGGGILVDGSGSGGGSPTVTNCIFIGNSATNGGGMLITHNCFPTVTNCTFIENSCIANGGGIHNEVSSDPIIRNCTFSGNAATTNGGGMYSFTDSNPEVANCIFWDNSDNGGTDESAQVHDGGTAASTVTYSCIQGCTTFCADPNDRNIGDDPLFVDPDGADNIPGTLDDNLRLSPGSPCIDAGDNSVVTEPTDLDGNPRIVDDPDVVDTGNGTCPLVDMGAYEFQASGTEDCNGNDIPDSCDITGGTSQDCNSNGIPDECEPDCQPNGIPDECDIADGTSEDCNGNGVPDECEGLTGCPDDWDCDGVADAMDVCPCTPCSVTSVDEAGRPRADLDWDCDVDLGDFVIFAGQFGATDCP